MRLAVGASRGQLLRQLLIESAVLSVLGGALGLLLSVTMVHGLLRFLPANGMLATLRAAPDWRILGFNVSLAFATAFLFGLAPAWQALKVELWTALKDAAGSVGGNRGSVTLRCVMSRLEPRLPSEDPSSAKTSSAQSRANAS